MKGTMPGRMQRYSSSRGRSRALTQTDKRWSASTWPGYPSTGSAGVPAQGKGILAKQATATKDKYRATAQGIKSQNERTAGKTACTDPEPPQQGATREGAVSRETCER